MNMKGITTENVDRKTSRTTAMAPSASVLVNPGRPRGSGSRDNFCRINSNCSGARTDANSGGSASAMTRRAAVVSAASRTDRSVRMLRPRSLRRAMGTFLRR